MSFVDAKAKARNLRFRAFAIRSYLSKSGLPLRNDVLS
jgi:hypothetical protein